MGIWPLVPRQEISMKLKQLQNYPEIKCQLQNFVINKKLLQNILNGISSRNYKVWYFRKKLILEFYNLRDRDSRLKIIGFRTQKVSKNCCKGTKALRKTKFSELFIFGSFGLVRFWSLEIFQKYPVFSNSQKLRENSSEISSEIISCF